ncbi:unnamed protein product [Phytophthora fragariaefolia]|uniref:Unnamed protein product n=1 Tax=Phytophthora fragariaefolia TaxID=1490495 RepID=A0A9W7D0G9_9STRA|nr:unnamed protein product [Phytophthora fragariaefolia]
MTTSMSFSSFMPPNTGTTPRTSPPSNNSWGRSLATTSRLDTITNIWEYTQAGISGRYSSDRARSLASYVNEVSFFRTAAVLLSTPLPCLLVTVLVDFVELDDPSSGLHGNTTFIVREYASYWLMSFLGAQQFRTSVPILPYPMKLVKLNTFVVAAISISVLYVFAMVIGFPVPFTIITGCTGWISSLSVSLVLVWMKPIRERPEAWPMVINVFKEWMCQVVLVIVYPLYFYVFTTLSHLGQILFALLLSLIKILARSAFTHTVVHLRDDMPEVVIFNAEVFNALFVSYCMQTSPSIWTTLELMVADIIQMMLSLRKINMTHDKLEVLSRQIEEDNCGGNCSHFCKRKDETREKLAPLKRTPLLLSSVETQATPLYSLVRMSSALAAPGVKCKPKGPRRTGSVPAKNNTLATIAPSSPTTRRLFKQHSIIPSHILPQLPITVQYTMESQRLLYMVEFVLLHNYVEVIIPLVFSSAYIGKRIVVLYTPASFAIGGDYHTLQSAWAITHSSAIFCFGETVRWGPNQAGFLGVLQCPGFAPALW